MSDPPPGEAFRKRLWPKGVAIPEGWQLSEELSELLSSKYPNFVVICGWFDPTWDEGKGMGVNAGRKGEHWPVEKANTGAPSWLLLSSFQGSATGLCVAA